MGTRDLRHDDKVPMAARLVVSEIAMRLSDRRQFLSNASTIAMVPLASILNAGCESETDQQQVSARIGSTLVAQSPVQPESQRTVMKIHYLEIVTKDVDAVCKLYSTLHGCSFAEPDTNLGNARTTKLDDGTILGVRAPMHAAENPVVRPYVLVKDIEASVKAASDTGAQIAVPPMKLGNHGTCAIFLLNGSEFGLWQV